MAISFSSMTDILHNAFRESVTYTYHDNATPATLYAVRDNREQEYTDSNDMLLSETQTSFHFKIADMTRKPERKDLIVDAGSREYDVLSHSEDGEGLEYIVRVAEVDK